MKIKNVYGEFIKKDSYTDKNNIMYIVGISEDIMSKSKPFEYFCIFFNCLIVK